MVGKRGKHYLSELTDETDLSALPMGQLFRVNSNGHKCGQMIGRCEKDKPQPTEMMWDHYRLNRHCEEERLETGKAGLRYRGKITNLI